MATEQAARKVPYREKTAFDYSDYLRPNKLPHIWCPGCGHGIVLKSLLRAIDASGIQKDDIAMVSGIGCSSRTPGYVDFNTMHTLHGRALAYATGIKHARPKLKTIVTTGDGDALAIGGNHFIHACRRNMDMVILVYNKLRIRHDQRPGIPDHSGGYDIHDVEVRQHRAHLRHLRDGQGIGRHLRGQGHGVSLPGAGKDDIRGAPAQRHRGHRHSGFLPHILRQVQQIQIGEPI